jgi:hypothetical protein
MATPRGTMAAKLDVIQVLAAPVVFHFSADIFRACP